MKKIIITGAGGFLGGHLVDHFVSQSLDVIAVFHKEIDEDIQHTDKRERQKKELLARIRIQPKRKGQGSLTPFDGDITNIDSMRSLLNESQADVIVHAAALLIAPNLQNFKDVSQYEIAKNRFEEINKAEVLANCIAEYQNKNVSRRCAKADYRRQLGDIITFCLLTTP